MVSRLYRTTRAFLADYETILLQDEVRFQLFFGNLNAHPEDDYEWKFLGVILEDDSPIVFFMNPEPYNLQVNCMRYDLQAIKLLVDLLIAQNYQINGINTDWKTLQMFKQYFSHELVPHFSMAIMKLTELSYPCPTADVQILEPNQMNYFDKIVDMDVAFIEEIGEKADLDKIKMAVTKRIQEHHQLVHFNEQGEIVAVCHYARVMQKGVAISGVYTLPAFRNQGYSKRIMALACSKVLEKGFEYCTLFVEQGNPISNRVYADVGFKSVAEIYDYRLKQEKEN